MFVWKCCHFWKKKSPCCITEFFSKYNFWSNYWLWLFLSDFVLCLVCFFCLSLCLLCLIVSAYVWCLWNEWDVLSLFCVPRTHILSVYVSFCLIVLCWSLDFFCLESVKLKGLLKGSLHKHKACHKHLCPHICRSLVAILPETVVQCVLVKYAICNKSVYPRINDVTIITTTKCKFNQSLWIPGRFAILLNLFDLSGELTNHCSLTHSISPLCNPSSHT